MTLKQNFLAAVCMIASAQAALPEAIPLTRISDFLNQMTTAKGEFTQINPDGTISTGILYLHRPGRVRFEYDPPTEILVLASGRTVAIFDRKSNAGPQQFPLRRTPLSIILGRDVDLNTANMLTGHVSDETTTTITAQDPKHPEYGNIKLVFTDDPVELRQWIITDHSGQATTVIFGDLERGLDLSTSLFSILQEIEKTRTNP